MQMGLKIKALRLKNGITQEKLAERLNISSQAISKWENNNALPDISLLPELSVIFGVTIDELFSLTDENHLDRIEMSIESEYMLTTESFAKHNDFLTSMISNEKHKARAFTLLAELYNKQAGSYHQIAKDYAMQALKIEPTKKDNHSALCEATNGIICDWNMSNHHDMIEYYMSFIKENPTYARGYMWLLDLLIEDGRTEEAKDVLERMHKYDDSFRYVFNKALIAKKECNLELALGYIDEMMKDYSDEWMAWSSKADFLVRLCKYDEAISCFIRAYELQPSPKYTDSYESIAHIYEIRKDYKNAVLYYEKIIELLKSDWNIIDGEPVDTYRRRIDELLK